APARIPSIMPAAPGRAVTANAAIVVVRAAAPASSPIAGPPIAAGGPADTEASAEARRPAVIIAIIDDHGRRGRRGIGLASIGTEADITRRHPAGAVAAIDLAPAVAAGTGIDGGTRGKRRQPGIICARPGAYIDSSRNIGRRRESNGGRDQNNSRNGGADNMIFIKHSLK